MKGVCLRGRSVVFWVRTEICGLVWKRVAIVSGVHAEAGLGRG